MSVSYIRHIFFADAFTPRNEISVLICGGFGGILSEKFDLNRVQPSQIKNEIKVLNLIALWSTTVSSSLFREIFF